ncbi:MAG TPA: protein phosphatase 2C domain-containing protein [Caldimonas sp.]|nr:protein phosphatase 2C domain-containing protein [Caldimonas sp.]
MSTSLDIAAASRSELGQRKSNEDKVRVCREGSRWVAILADGAGGHRGGAEASRRAVDALEAALCDEDAEFSAAALTAAVLAAHDDVQAAQDASHGISRMHSTVVVLWIDLDRQSALWSHVGDSRLYRVRRGVVTALTSDDSVVQRMVDAGLITAAQAESHPQKSQLIAALGIEEGVEPHTVAAPHGLLEGDAFLLCSDGWWDVVDEPAIATSLAHATSPDDWLALMQEMIEAYAAPRQDNFSAVAVWVRDPIESTRPMTMF